MSSEGDSILQENTPLERRIERSLIRTALANEFKAYKIKIDRSWESHHALFSQFTLQKSKKPRPQSSCHRVTLVAKRFEQISSPDTVYGLVHHPDFLCNRELRNLRLIRKLAGHIVPLVYGADSGHNLLVMEYLPGSSFRETFLEKTKQLQSSPDDANLQQARNEWLYGGIRKVAEFVGRCNAKADKFCEEYPGYASEADLFARAGQELFKENLLRMAYYETIRGRQNPDSPEYFDYDPQKVDAYLKSGDNKIDLGQRLPEIWQLARSFNTRKIFMHGDLNSDHIRGRKLFDVEKFGPGYEVDDLSSFCILAPLGTNYLIKSSEFPHIVNRYLSYEYAFEQDPEAVSYLDKCSNGDFKKFLGESTTMTKESYANFMLDFLAHAVRKNIQLAAFFGRTGKESEMAVAIPNYICDLYREVLHFDANGRSHECTNYKEVGEYFYAMGHLLSDVGVVHFPDGMLDMVHQGTVAGRVVRETPDFKK